MPHFQENPQARALIVSLCGLKNREVASLDGGHTAHKYQSQNLTLSFLASELTSITSEGFRDCVLLASACQLWPLSFVHLLGPRMVSPEAGRHKGRLMGWPTNEGVIPKYFQATGGTQGQPPHQAHKSLTEQFSQDNLLSGLRKDSCRPQPTHPPPAPLCSL